jgi:hypothetical protein
MRLLITNVLAMALLIFGAASANAFSTSMSSNYGGGDLSTSDTVTVTVDFDSGSVGDIAILSVSVLFNDTVVSWDQGASASPTYAMYTGVRGSIALAELSTNMTLRTGTSDQILLDWSSGGLPAGTTTGGCGDYGTFPAVAGSPSGTGCVFTMATLVFHVDNQSGDAAFTLSNSSPGNIFQLGDNSNPANTVSGDFIVTTPEPTTALLVGLGLLGLGVAGRRRA